MFSSSDRSGIDFRNGFVFRPKVKTLRTLRFLLVVSLVIRGLEAKLLLLRLNLSINMRPVLKNSFDLSLSDHACRRPPPSPRIHTH